MKCPGIWYMDSKKDPRWNKQGRSKDVGNFEQPRECARKIEKLRETLGEPPDDLEWGYWKD